MAKYQIETALRELELKEKSGQLVERGAAEGQFFRLARTVRDNFQNLPARTAGLVCAERNQQRCYDILADEVQQILEGLTNGTPEKTTARRAATPG